MSTAAFNQLYALGKNTPWSVPFLNDSRTAGISIRSHVSDPDGADGEHFVNVDIDLSDGPSVIFSAATRNYDVELYLDSSPCPDLDPDQEACVVLPASVVRAMALAMLIAADDADKKNVIGNLEAAFDVAPIGPLAFALDDFLHPLNAPTIF